MTKAAKIATNAKGYLQLGDENIIVEYVVRDLMLPAIRISPHGALF